MEYARIYLILQFSRYSMGEKDRKKGIIEIAEAS